MTNNPILIAHRGNIEGRNPEMENHPDYIHAAIYEGFDVEVDLWKIGDDLMLGHDKPRYKVDLKFLQRKAPRLWVHAKDLQALEFLSSDNRFNVFCHFNDPRTLTTQGYIWTRSYDEDHDLKSIVLQLNYQEIDATRVGGVCTNYPMKFKELWSK
jgi:hypothetical protein